MIGVAISGSIGLDVLVNNPECVDEDCGSELASTWLSGLFFT